MTSANVVVFPFDQFGSAGTGAGAQMLGDVVHEMIDDTESETRPTLAELWRGRVSVDEVEFKTMEELRDWRNTGRMLASESIAEGNFLVWLAGNHLGVLPVLEELGPDALVIQFDAHLDIQAFHDTTEELSHGNFLLHAEKPLPKLVNVGHRDLLMMPLDVAEVFRATIPAEGLPDAAERLRKLTRGAKRVWIDLDCDAIDPVFLPAVQHPLPFGILPQTLLSLIEAIGFEKLIGVSISEFDPGRDVRDTSLNLLGWFIEWLLLKRFSPGRTRSRA